MIASTSWRKSSYSSPENNCVELAVSVNWAGIRDSKNAKNDGLAFAPAPFYDFLALVKADAVHRLT